YTVGHSTHPIDDFISMVRAHGVERIADIRSIPRSRHNPQFAAENMQDSLAGQGLAYGWIGRLGGLRHARQDSINDAWRNASFRGFADYMQTDEFVAGLAELIELAQTSTVAIMCAEA